MSTVFIIFDEDGQVHALARTIEQVNEIREDDEGLTYEEWDLPE